MSSETQWYVLQGGEQSGPYSGEQLVEFAAGGNIARESMVWAEGMEEWLPAGSIEGIFPPEPVPAQVVPQGTQVSGYYVSHGQQPTGDGSYPTPGVKAASFGLWVGMYLGGIALVIIGVLLLINMAAAASRANDGAGELTATHAGGAGLGLIIMMGGYFLSLLSLIPFYMYIYRAWVCLQPGGLARTSPGKAIGFLFIPVFNLYWIFQAIYGLAVDWNKTVSAHGDLKVAPKLSEGVFLTFCIGCFLFPLNLIMIFPVMSGICTAVNYFAYRPKPGQHSALGGLRLG